MIDDLTDPFEKLTVVEESLQEDSQCVIDILSRFLFESKIVSSQSIPINLIIISSHILF